MRDEKLSDVIKDLNKYHEEKERRYFEKNLFKQKLGKYILFFIILLLIAAIILILTIFPKGTGYEEPVKTTFDFVRRVITVYIV